MAAQDKSLYTLIPLEDLLKISIHADFQHGVFSTKKLQLKQWKQRHPCRLKQWGNGNG
jgi:hypothetical protein